MTANSFYIQVWMMLLGKNAKLTKIVRCLTYIAMDSASKKKDVWWHVNLRGKVSNKCGNQIYQLIAQHSKKSLFEIEGKEEKETDGTQENDDSCCSCNGTVVPKGQRFTPDGCNFGDCGGRITKKGCMNKDEQCKSCKNNEDEDAEEEEEKETDGTQENDDSCCSCNGTVVPKGQRFTPDGCNFGTCGGLITKKGCLNKDEQCKSCKNNEDEDAEEEEKEETDGTQENDDSCCSCNGTVVPKGQKYTPDGCNFGDCGGAITWMSCKDEHCKSCKNKEDKDEEEDEDEGKENKEDIQEKEDKKEKEDKQANEDKKEKEDKKETQTKEGKEEKKGKGEKKGKV